MKREFRLPVLLGLGLGCALLLREGLQSPIKAPPAVVNVKPIGVPMSLSPRQLPPRQLTHKGVLYSLPFGKGAPPSMYVFEIDFGKGYLDRTPHVLHNHKGGLYLRGKSYGNVEFGDHVQVTTSNRVFVNGQERLPTLQS